MLLTPKLEDFCAGHLVLTKDRKIVYCNQYVAEIVGQPVATLIDSSLSQWCTKGTSIFIDSYIFPLLLSDLQVQETQINWKGENNMPVPVVANIKLGSNGESYWSMHTCINRDKLQSELLKAKEQLTKQSEALFKLATTDSLTGLLNRRELDVQADKLAHQADRNNSTFALLCIDVDFFKKVNDSFGHQTGDRVLQRFSELLLEGRRTNDLVARTGGEEFVIVLADIDEQNAYIIAEKLRTKIELTALENIKITASIGLVVSERNNKVKFTSLLNAADKALYLSKDNGRNKTTSSKNTH